MRFSIIIPAFNAENHIRKALDSIACQTFKDYELIVICDKCKDHTSRIAKEYGAITKDINYGRDGVSRNYGLALAQGEYVLFMDDDDWWLHEFVLEQLDEKLTQTGNPDILAFSFIFHGVCYAQPKRLDGNYWIAVWSKCWKREIIGKTKFPDIYSVSDRYFVEKVFSKNPNVVDWDMPMYYYNYLRKGSISEKMGRTFEETRKYC